MQEQPLLASNISKTENKKFYKIFFISLCFAIVVFGIVFILFPSPKTLVPQIKENILSGENYFSNARYKEARIAYKKALDIAGASASRFLEIRYRMAIYLARMDQLISQGDSEEVRHLLDIGKKEEWPQEKREI